MWSTGLEYGNKLRRDNLPFILARKGRGSVNTGRFLPNTKGNQGYQLLTRPRKEMVVSPSRKRK